MRSELRTRWFARILGAVVAASITSSAPAWSPAAEPSPTPIPDAPAVSGRGDVVSEPSGAAEEVQSRDVDQPDSAGGGETKAVTPSGGGTNPGAVAFTDYRPFDLESIEEEPFDSKWRAMVAGLRGITRYSLFDGQVKFRLGLQAQIDGTAGFGSDSFEESFAPIESSLDLRRGVVYAVGRVKSFNFNLGFDFGADLNVDSAWIEGAEGGLEVWGKFLGKLRLGYVDEPFSLERQTSSYNLGFLERSLPVQTMAPGTNVGALIHSSARDGRTSWAAGVYSLGVKTEQNASNSVLSLTGRVTRLLSYRDDGRRLVHIGTSFSYRSPTSGEVRYRSRPEARFVDPLADTGDFEAGRTILWGLEAAVVRGPMWAAAEYIVSDVSADQAGDPRFRGGYVQVGWFLTGEARPYRKNSGAFDRVLPQAAHSADTPFRIAGAWEVVGRFSALDLTDGAIDGGRLTDLSAALNWYLSAATRISLNYVRARPDDAGTAHIFLLRLQLNPY